MKPLFPKLGKGSNSCVKNKKLKLLMNDLTPIESKPEKQYNYRNIYFNNIPYINRNMITSYSKKKPKIFFKDKLMSPSSKNITNSKYDSIDEYNKTTDNLMLRYTYSKNPSTTTHYETFMTRTKAKFFNKAKENIENILNKSRAIFKNVDIRDKENSPQIYIGDMEFKNPIDSLGSIINNKIIHDKVLKNYSERTIENYSNKINKISQMKHKMNLNKSIKIISIMPQTFEKEFLEQENKEIKQPFMSPNKENVQIKKEEINFRQQDSLPNKFSLVPTDFMKGWVYLLTGYHKFLKIYPESREQFTFNYDPISNCIFLFSGYSSYIGSQQLWKYNLLNNEWTPIKSTIYNMDARSGHTAIIYKNKLIIFGGRYLHNTLMSDLDIFNIEDNTWNMMQVNTCYFLELRRNHIACLVGNQMFIHGGIDEKGEYLDDSYLLGLNSQYNWTKANISLTNIPPKLGYHSCCLVAPSEYIKNSKFSIYKFPEINISENTNTQIKEIGIYIFGGKKSELKDPSNKLWVLKIGKKNLEWLDIKTRGKPPCPRYLCSMNFYEQGNFLIIHGGKTKTLINENVLRDTYLLELYRFEWIKVNYGFFDHTVKPRFSHSGVVYQNKLIIFGGVNDKGYDGSNFFLIKLQPEDFNQSVSPSRRNSILKNQLTLENENVNQFITNGIIKDGISAVKAEKKEIISTNKKENIDKSVKKNKIKKNSRNATLPYVPSRKKIK